MKLTKEGWAVIEGDNYLSADIIAQGRLDVARDYLQQFKQYIPEGGVVLDVGACLGDYTATFSEFVGPRGHVIAFEPNPDVMECLTHNMKPYSNVTIHPIALSDTYSGATFQIDSNNIGASWLKQDEHGLIGMVALDDVFSWSRLDFIKIDAEGYEPYILAGAKETLRRLKPVLLIEIDQRALSFQNFIPEDIHSRLDALAYNFPRFDGAHGNILCLPKERV